MRYLGVSRAELYSPNRVSGDAAVFRAVAAELERHGHEVICMNEQDLTAIPDGIDGIFHMARSSEALEVIGRADVPVTNTVQAVMNCGRARQTEMLKDSGLIPESLICRTGGVPLGWNTFPCWIKRADSHAVERDDVQFIQDAGECNNAMLGFWERGMKECVLQAHVKGWLVKFYGVRGFGLADCYAATEKEGKFGLERYNDQPDQACVDMDALTAAANRVSDLLGVDVFGGDAVVGDDGKITIIDFNDWPSFRTCTVGAAQKIADLIMSKR
jgi:hypothetical protein